MRRGRRGVTLVCFLAAALLAGAKANGQDRQALRVLVPENRAEAFVSTQPGQESGFDYEILKGFADLHRMKLTFVPSSSWDGLIPALLEGKADLIAGGFSDTAARRKRIDFSVEVFPSRDVVLTLKPHRPVTSLEQLRGERVVTHRGTSMAEALLAAGVPAANIVHLTDGNVSDQLRAGRATAGVLGLEVAILARRTDPNLELGLFLGQSGSLAYGLRKTDPELKRDLDAYLANLRRTPTWSRLVVKYFGEQALEILKAARSGPP